MMKGCGVAMIEASVQNLHSGGERDRDGRGGGGGGVNRVELVRAVTSVEYHPGASVLNQKTTLVKLNGNMIFMCKRTNRDKIFNKIRRN